MTMLITGASGTVGSALVSELRAAGQPCRAAYHSAERTERALAAGQDAVTVEMADPATLGPALDGVDAVFLLGAMGPDQTRRELNMVDAAVAAGVPRIVKLSIWRVEEELTPIAALHRPVEVALAAAPVAWTFLRPNFYHQAFTTQWAAGIRDRGLVTNALLRGPISFVDGRDVAKVAARVLVESGHDGQTYVLTGPAALTMRQATDVLSTVLGRPIRYVGMSDDEARAALASAGVPGFAAEALVEVSRVYRDGGAEQVTSTVRDLTGSDPVDFERFVRDHEAVFH